MKLCLKCPSVFSGSPVPVGTDREAGNADGDDVFLPASSSRSMAKTSPRPPMTRRWRPSALPRSPSWSRFCAEPPSTKLWARLLTPRSQTSVPRPTSPFSTSRLSQTCLPPRPKYRSWRSICFLKSECFSRFMFSKSKFFLFKTLVFCFNPQLVQVILK